ALNLEHHVARGGLVVRHHGVLSSSWHSYGPRAEPLNPHGVPTTIPGAVTPIRPPCLALPASSRRSALPCRPSPNPILLWMRHTCLSGRVVERQSNPLRWFALQC